MSALMFGGARSSSCKTAGGRHTVGRQALVRILKLGSSALSAGSAVRRRYIDSFLRKRGPPQTWGSRAGAALKPAKGGCTAGGPSASAPEQHHRVPLVDGAVAAIAASAAAGAPAEVDDESERDDYWSSGDDE